MIVRISPLPFLICFAALLASACGGASETPAVDGESVAAEAVTLKVGYLPISAALPLFVAHERGFFEDAGVKVELVKYQNGALMAEDVITGRLAAASPGPGDVYLAKEVDTPGRFKIYLHSAYTPENFIYSILTREDSGINTLEDLKGKKIAVFPGVTNKLLLELLLEDRFGWRPDEDFSVQGVAPALQLDALEAGEYDALCPLEPTGTIGLSRPALQMIDRGPIEAGVLNPLYITAHALSARVQEESPDAIRAFVTAMETAVDQIREEEESSRRLLTQFTSLNEEQALQTPIGLLKKLGEINREDFQKLADLLHQEGVLTQPVDVDGLYYAAL